MAVRRVAGDQLAGCAADHFDHMIDNFGMHTQQVQRRAALTGTSTGTLHHRITHRARGQIGIKFRHLRQLRQLHGGVSTQQLGKKAALIWQSVIR